MKELLVLVTTAVTGLALAGAAQPAPTAQTGCMATVGLSSQPKSGFAAGTPWIVTIRVMQHGVTPMSDAKPQIRIRKAGGKLIVFKGNPTSRIGSYRARVVFPTAGTYTLRVYDGFPYAECAKVHSFGTVVVDDDV